MPRMSATHATAKSCPQRSRGKLPVLSSLGVTHGLAPPESLKRSSGVVPLPRRPKSEGCGSLEFNRAPPNAGLRAAGVYCVRPIAIAGFSAGRSDQGAVEARERSGHSGTRAPSLVLLLFPIPSPLDDLRRHGPAALARKRSYGATAGKGGRPAGALGLGKLGQMNGGQSWGSRRKRARESERK